MYQTWMNEQHGGAQKPLNSTQERHTIISDIQYVFDTHTNTIIDMNMFQPFEEHL